MRTRGQELIHLCIGEGWEERPQPLCQAGTPKAVLRIPIVIEPPAVMKHGEELDDLDVGTFGGRDATPIRQDTGPMPHPVYPLSVQGVPLQDPPPDFGRNGEIPVRGTLGGRPGGSMHG